MTFFQRIKTPFSESPADEQALLQPRMRMIGDALQERREDLGLDLDEVGAMLRIKPSYLAALEQGRLGDLPGPTYAIGFVRAYSDFLGLDTAQVLARFKAEASDVTARPDLALPVPLGERSLPGGALVLVALILALCGYGIWYYLSTEERSRSERVAALPASLQPAASTPVLVPPPPLQPTGANPAADNSTPPPPSLYGAAGSPSQAGMAIPAPTPHLAPTQQPAATPPQTAQYAQTSPAAAGGALATGTLLTPIPRNTAAPAPQPGASPPAPIPQPTAAPSPPAPPPQPGAISAAIPTQASTAATPLSAAAAATSQPGAAGGGHVAIKAVADCWIQVRASDQSIVFSRVLKSGEVYNVPARPGLSLRTGNAGALEILVDGKTVPSIGGIGALRRDVALDPGELAAGTAVHG